MHRQMRQTWLKAARGDEPVAQTNAKSKYVRQYKRNTNKNLQLQSERLTNRTRKQSEEPE